MSEPSRMQDPPVAPEETIGQAIQSLMAARLGRGFVPLATLAIAGLLELAFLDFAGGGGLVLMLGALVAAVAMLGFGLRISQLAFGRSERPWMFAARVGGLIPPGFALYVVAWRGLRPFAAGSGIAGLLAAGFFTVVGVWCMHSWMKVLEMVRLSRAMAAGLERESGA
jgi:hypothetical protein